MDDDVTTWYLLVHDFSGDEEEYAGGSYLFRLQITDNFPVDPPKVFPLTPNGVYDTQGTICLEVGDLHRAQYPATMGMSGFTEQILSGFIGWRYLKEGSIGIISTTTEEKKRLAAASTAYNAANYANILAKFTP